MVQWWNGWVLQADEEANTQGEIVGSRMDKKTDDSRRLKAAEAKEWIRMDGGDGGRLLVRRRRKGSVPYKGGGWIGRHRRQFLSCDGCEWGDKGGDEEMAELKQLMDMHYSNVRVSAQMGKQRQRAIAYQPLSSDMGQISTERYRQNIFLRLWDSSFST